MKNTNQKKKSTQKTKKHSGILMRSARKTIAGLLMVTAIIIAAIPGNPSSAMIHENNKEEFDKTNSSKGVADYTPVTIGGVQYAGLFFFRSNGTLTDIKGIKVTVDIDHEDIVTTDPSGNQIVDEGTETTTYTLETLDKTAITDLNMSKSEVSKISKESGLDKMVNLQSITMPSSLTEIGASAFKNLASLKSVTNMAGLTEIGDSAFEGCSSLKTFSGANAVKEVGDKAFLDCSSLSAFPDSPALTEIGISAFENCKSLTAFSFPAAITSNGIKTRAFAGSGIRNVSINENAKLDTIPASAFENCDKLTGVSLGSGVTTLNDSAFAGCSSLTSISMSDNVSNIGNLCFEGCESLRSFNFPANLSKLGKSVLKDCTSLSEVNFNISSLGKVKYTALPDYTFQNCSSLTELSLPEGVKTAASTALSGCEGLKKISLPEGFLSIPAQLFDDCDELREIYVYDEDTTFPNTDPFAVGNSVIIYGYNDSTAQTFANSNGHTFKSLNDDTMEADFYTINEAGYITKADAARLLSYSTSITIPETVNGQKVVGIAENVFKDNSRLTEITIPSCVKEIKDKAFAGCSKLKVVHIESDETTFADNTFNDTNENMIIHTPISESSVPFNRAMENNLTVMDDDYGIEVKRDPATEENVLVAYDENKSTLIVPTGVDRFGEKGSGTASGTSIFEGNDKLTTVQINSIKQLSDHQFKNCKNLQSVSLPANMNKMGKAPFYGCSSLSDVTIEPGNDKFLCENGIIYEKNGAEKTAIVESLPGYTKNNKFVIPSTVKNIYEEAFASPQNINSIYFSSGVSAIPERCFADSGIMQAYLTDAVHSIGKQAFMDSDGENPYLAGLHVPNASTVISDSATDGVYGLTLYGHEGSTAEYYADVNEYRDYSFEADGGDGPGESSSKKHDSSSDDSSSKKDDSSSISSSDKPGTSSNSKKSSSKKSSSKKKSKSKSSSKKSSSKKSSSNKNSSSSVNNNQTTNLATPGATAPVPAVVTSNGTANQYSAGNAGNAAVDTSQSDIPRNDLVSGSIDNGADDYVIKISRTDEAEEAFKSALEEKYGDLDNIRYYSMDISLYDPDGKEKIEDTEGIEVTVTIPIPDELALYGGNNHAAAVKNGELEDLGTRFSSIDGVPCVTFTAKHFSPYGLYVDVTDLSASDNLDKNPKTGDPISPKWFLVIGLAALSVFLFLKKDRA